MAPLFEGRGGCSLLAAVGKRKNAEQGAGEGEVSSLRQEIKRRALLVALATEHTDSEGVTYLNVAR